MTDPTMALTIGMTGQDRPCLAELPLDNGYEFYGSAGRAPQFGTSCAYAPERSRGQQFGQALARAYKVIIDPQAEKYYWSGLYERRVQEAVAQHLDSAT